MDKVIKYLKDQVKAEREYNNKFIQARREVKERDKQRETSYQKFKKEQKKISNANDRLLGYLK